MYYRFGFKTNAHILMYSLATSDLLSCLLMPVSVTDEVLRHDKSLRKVWRQLCFFKELVNHFVGISNMFNYCLITIDRFILVNHALKYKVIFTKKRLKCAIFGIWLLSAVLDIVSFIFMANIKSVEKWGCYISHIFTSNGYYSLVAGTLICTILMLVLYTKIILRLNARDKERQNMGVNSQMVASKVTKALAMVVGIYLGLYIPSIVIGVLANFIKGIFMYVIYDVSILCFYMNNSINAFIYYIRMPEFKAECKDIFQINKHNERTHDQKGANTENVHI